MKRIGVVSDLHCGSVFGMLPPDFVKSDGGGIEQNAGQRYLWACWLDAACAMGKLNALIVNGDAIDGRQQAQRGTELSLPMMADQAEAAERCLKVFWKTVGRPPIYFVQGTEYHDAKAGREIEVIARAMSAERYAGLGTGLYSREVLDLETEGVIGNFSHGISTAGGLYRATPPDREGIWSALAGKEGKMPKADYVVRSHAHGFVHVEHSSKHIVVTPCWQLQTRFMRKNSVYRMIPDIGVIGITVNGKAKKHGDDPCLIEKKIYPLPPFKTSHLE